jgi:large subunit ribosomal protein L21
MRRQVLGEASRLTGAAFPPKIRDLSPALAGFRLRSTGDSSMYAVVKTGGKQYRVSEGLTIRVEKIDAEPGASIELGQVLMVAEGDQIRVGTPFIEGGKVTATVGVQGKCDKVHIVKFRRRKHYLKRQGHRQRYTELKITGISAP